MIDYTILYKTELPLGETWSFNWDLFVSAFSPTERVKVPFEKANANHKKWLIFPEYNFNRTEYPEGPCFFTESRNEAEYITEFWETLDLSSIEDKSICIDITGFIRPYLMFIIKLFKEYGIKKFDAIYSEPIQYTKREDTLFTDESVINVRQVNGFEGIHITDTSKDILIIGAGYEEHLIAHAAENKDNAKKIQLFGFPSLKADMYQENVIKAQRAEESVGGDVSNYFAPSNDPFVTANVLQGIINEHIDRELLTNVYLCPVATKPQLLGFVLYYLTECINLPASIILPFSKSYSKESSIGILRIWKYTIEFLK